MSDFYNNEIKPFQDFIKGIDFKHPDNKPLLNFIFTHQYATGLTMDFLDPDNEVPDSIKRMVFDKFKELYP